MRAKNDIMTGAFLLFWAVSISAAQTQSKPEQDGMESLTLPKWEVGLALGAASIPDYPGSDEYATYVLPVPYFIYRGDRIRAGRGGIRGIFLKSDHFKSAISMSASPPVDDDNEAREGMPDREILIEVGPALKMFLNHREDPDPFYLSVAARAVMSIEGDYEGLRGHLGLNYRNTTLFRDNGVRFGFRCRLGFADRDYHSYYYDVAEEFVTDNRPAYRSEAGYSGFSVAGSISKRVNEDFRVAVFGGWYDLSGAAFKDSPLVADDNYFAFGAAFVWRPLRSKTLVRLSEEDDR